MNCPACLSIMYNHDEIHKISPTKNRMNLHCCNMNCSSRKNKPYYGPYVQVITSDPSPWECINYGLIVNLHKPVLIEGSFYNNNTSLSVIKTSTIPVNIWKKIFNMSYIQLSTNNDMHTQAIKIANKLVRLLPFS